MQQGKDRRQAELLTGGRITGKEGRETSSNARNAASSGHDRECYSEYMERNFSYYPKF